MADPAVAHFDQWSAHYDRSVLQRLLFRPVHRVTIAQVGSRAGPLDTLLDVGCGTGRLLRSIRNGYPSASLVGVDVAFGMVRQAFPATRVHPPISVVNASVTALPFPDRHFDVVVSTLSFHHWADQQRGLHEVRRVLRDRGTFVLADIVAASWLRTLLAFRPSEGHFLSPEALAEAMEAARLRLVRRVAVPWHPQVAVTVAEAGE